MPIELTIEGGRELYDESEQRFYTLNKTVTLKLEHSLLSLAKWESKWKTPFLIADPRGYSEEKTRDYIRCMTINEKQIDPVVYRLLSPDELMYIADYINDSMTATVIRNNDRVVKKSGELVTAETIYFWMVEFRIPIELEKWHLNRLMTLINFISIKHQPAKKMSKNEIISQNDDLNARRRAELNSKG